MYLGRKLLFLSLFRIFIVLHVHSYIIRLSENFYSVQYLVRISFLNSFRKIILPRSQHSLSTPVVKALDLRGKYKTMNIAPTRICNFCSLIWYILVKFIQTLGYLRHCLICLPKFRFIISSSESISASLFIFRIFGAISLIFARISINFASCILGFKNRKGVFIFS